MSVEEIRKNGNKLKESASLYLRQHAFNPVFWYPWSEEAHQKAILENKPIFLSVGYSSCHWCHVMEVEVFEKNDVAEYLNEHFVCIKVDREEKPDIDSVYMRAVQAMTGSGGWPMSVFLTPDLKPFFGGTYYPKDAFLNLSSRILSVFVQKNDQLMEQAENLYHSIANTRTIRSDKEVSLDQIESVTEFAKNIFDDKWGGFKSQMKFPTPNKWNFLLHFFRYNKKPEIGEMIEATLDAIQNGGIHDHLAGGFHRYTVDQTWTVPHFEKMLYDNAQLASLFFEASVVLNRTSYQNTATSILDFLLSEMSDEKHTGFYSSFDADSDGEEGTFYVWSYDEVEKTLGNNASLVCDFYGITPRGNFEGQNVLTINNDYESLAKRYNLTPLRCESIISESKAILLKNRSKRVPPTLDKKIVLSWNALTISALVKGYRVTGEIKYLKSAEDTADFILESMSKSDGTFYRTFSDEKLVGEAVLDDYSFLADSLIDLFEVTGKDKYLTHTKSILNILENEFMDTEDGFYFTHSSTKTPLGRQREVFDNVEPSGYSIALKAFFRMGWLLFEKRYIQIAEDNITHHQELMERAKLDMSGSYDVALMTQIPFFSTVIASDSLSNTLFAEYNQIMPFNSILIPSHKKNNNLKNLVSGLDDKNMLNEEPTAYLCEFGICMKPFVNSDEFMKYLL